ncbi:hypothetical protein [uncultured Winogradskyella sp.]|uniref:hypothetical protein n=1 Tax=uncultured Winogradskyella sp. TaxID=395353 RepID=UPI0026102522|nr:hypothetical protein [uncultured Winogradskyella sp.]
MSRISKSDILYLFDELWPLMPYAQDHKRNCLEQLKPIENYFAKYSLKENHDELLIGLDSLDGIGLTIASGLIWSAHRKDRVPFDKYTMTYALELKLLRTEKISNDYIEVSEIIKEYCDGMEFEDGSEYEIENFVRDAMIEMEDKDYLIEPK